MLNKTYTTIVIDLLQCLSGTYRCQQSLQNRPFKQMNTKNLIDQSKCWSRYAVDVETIQKQ